MTWIAPSLRFPQHSGGGPLKRMARRPARRRVLTVRGNCNRTFRRLGLRYWFVLRRMSPVLRRGPLLALALTLVAGPAAAAVDEPPVIGKYRAAPVTKPNVAPLPPAEFDNKLAVEGH